MSIEYLNCEQKKANYAVSSQVIIKDDKVIFKNEESIINISMKCPIFEFDNKKYGFNEIPLVRTGDFNKKDTIKIEFKPIILDEFSKLIVMLFLEWVSEGDIIFKWSKFYIDSSRNKCKQEKSLSEDNHNCKTVKNLEEVILEHIDLNEAEILEFSPTSVQSAPVFFDGFFAGIEYPVASTRLENQKLLLAHRPGLNIEPGVWYETKKAVFGLAQKGKEKSAFFKYLSTKTFPLQGIHVNYNSWWTSPAPYSESHILQIMEVFEEKLYENHTISFDTFCIDCGWSEPYSLWGINSKLFPDGFNNLLLAADRMNSKLGLWISPSACYDGALNNDWAKENGYETASISWLNNSNLKLICLGGEKYQKEFKENIKKIVSKYNISHLKVESICFLECNEINHGHQLGLLSSERIAEGIIEFFREVRLINPDIWIEATCFGWNPSPWWLFYVNSVLGTYGDDSPYGRTPCPIFRESYTTARDYFNLQGIDKIPIPIKNQEVLGIIHQTSDDFTNDAVMTIMRGHMFLPVYLNPKFMNESRWKAFSDIIKWARLNSELLQETKAILPSTWINGNSPSFTNNSIMPREPYGYAHWNDNKGIIALRNPWISPTSYKLKLPEDISMNGKVNVVGIFPEPRIYGKKLDQGSVLEVPLAPYETIVLSIDANCDIISDEVNTKLFDNYIKIGIIDKKISRDKKMGCTEIKCQGNGDMDTEDENFDFIRIKVTVKFEILSPRGELLILLEGKSPVYQPEYSILIDNEEAIVASSVTEGSWVYSSIPSVEHWLFLIRIPVSNGTHKAEIDIIANDRGFTDISSWIWALKPGRLENNDSLNTLPQPEIISLDAVPIFEYKNDR